MMNVKLSTEKPAKMRLEELIEIANDWKKEVELKTKKIKILEEFIEENQEILNEY